MKMKKILLSAPHMSGNEQRYIEQAINSNWVVPLGPLVDEFEERLKNRVLSKATLALNSGTAALHLALCVLGVSHGDKVFCSSFTFVAGANPILYQGALPVFIDSEPASWNMSSRALARALDEAQKNNQLPKAVIIANLYGQPANYSELLPICEQFNVPIIEDAAESLGAMYQGKASGTFGKLGVYSFNGNKIITTSGGGMLLSDDEVLMEKARFLSTQAKATAPYYLHHEVGFNYRLSNVLAGIGLAQLDVLDSRIKKRQAIFARYKKALADIAAIQFMPTLKEAESTHWLSCCLIDKKISSITPRQVVEQLATDNIEARYLWHPMHKQPLFEAYQYYAHEKNNSVCDHLFLQGFCLPSGSGLSDEEIDYVIASVRKLFMLK